MFFPFHLLVSYTDQIRRWVRLLFGREFPFDEVLSIWDLLFAEDPQLELVDHICIAMLLRIRWECKNACDEMHGRI